MMCVDIKDINLYDITIFAKFKDISKRTILGYEKLRIMIGL